MALALVLRMCWNQHDHTSSVLELALDDSWSRPIKAIVALQFLRRVLPPSQALSWMTTVPHEDFFVLEAIVLHVPLYNER
jgi:hypothetical protein